MAEWTDEDDAILRAGYQDRLSARAIGQKLGRTRNAILGRAFRLALGSGGGHQRQSERLRAEAARRAEQRRLEKEARREALFVALRRLKHSDRNSSIRELRRLGYLLSEIGEFYGITRERVRQICESSGPWQQPADGYYQGARIGQD